MAAITKRQVLAATAAFSIVRSVVDEVKPNTGGPELEQKKDRIVFDKLMKAMAAKEAANG